MFAKRPLPKFTQFGPFVGELVDREVVLTNSDMPILVSNKCSLSSPFDVNQKKPMEVTKGTKLLSFPGNLRKVVKLGIFLSASKTIV